MDLGSPLTCLDLKKGNFDLIVGGYFGDIFALDLRKSEDDIIKFKGHNKRVYDLQFANPNAPKRANLNK